MSIKQRYGYADYLNVGTASEENYALMGTGFTKIDEKPGAQTSSKRYVNSRSMTKRITGYDSEFTFELDQILDEEAVAFIVDIGKLRKTGSDAETTYVQVDLDNPIASSTGEYEARKFAVAVQVDEFPDNDGEMGGSGKLLTIGDPIVGKFNTTTKTCTAKEA